MRLPFLPPAELSAEQKPLYEEMKGGIAAKYSNFTTMRGDGAILGPWSAWLHDPDLGRALWEATKGMTRFQNVSVVGQRCSGLSSGPASWKHQIVRHPRQAPSPLCPDLGFQYTASGNRENVR
jgi:hypothetical protein